MIVQLSFCLHLLSVLFREIFEIILGIFVSKKPKSVKGKLALVSGGGRGLGKCLALRLAQEGCDIAICDVNLSEAQETSEEICKTFNVKSEAFKCDVRDVNQIKKLSDDIKSRFGYHVDILVNNAGILAPLAATEGEDKDVQRVVDVNLSSHFWMVRTFLPKMIEKKYGHIVGIASAAGKMAVPFATFYTATKFGVNGFYKALYEDICVFDHDDYIKVTCAFPGFLNTRKDLVDLLKDMKDVLPRLSPEEGADRIIKAMLLDKRDISFPWAYQLAVMIESICPPKTLKLVKNAIANVNINQEGRRIEMTRM